MQIKSKVWSNAFFIIPLAIALHNGLFLHSTLIFLVIIFSTLFHLSDEKKFKFMDLVFAFSLIAFNLYLCYLSKFRQPCFILALFFAAVGCYFYFKKKRDDWEWHLSCAIITIFCILGYIL